MAGVDVATGLNSAQVAERRATYGSSRLSAWPWARSMALATFSFMNVAFALGTRDLHRSVFSQETLADRTLLIGTGVGVLVTILASQLGLLQRLLSSVALSFDQWIICAAVGFSVLLVSEVRKLAWNDLFDENDDAAEGAGEGASSP